MRMRYAIVISYSNWLRLATEGMIHSHSVKSGSDYVELIWTRPKFFPKRYQLIDVCTKKPTCTHRHKNSTYVTKRMQNLSSDCNSVKISDLRPSSICILLLLAVYNPASIDTGIAIIGAVLDEDTRNITSGQGYFITMINYCYMFPFNIQRRRSRNVGGYIAPNIFLSCMVVTGVSTACLLVPAFSAPPPSGDPDLN